MPEGGNPPVPLWVQASRAARTGGGLIAGITDLESKGYNLEIEHVPTGRFVSFPAFVENFSDAYTSEWGTEQVFGRMDPIATFSTTRRAISVAWIIPADSVIRARENMERINILMQMLYPLYTKREGATTMNMGPLMRIRYLNLMQNSVDEGLLGYVNGFTMDPLTEEGTFYGESENGNPTVYPKTVRLNFELTVLHEHPVGWVKSEGRYTEYRDGKGKSMGSQYVWRGQAEAYGGSVNDSSQFPYDARADIRDTDDAARSPFVNANIDRRGNIIANALATPADIAREKRVNQSTANANKILKGNK